MYNLCIIYACWYWARLSDYRITINIPTIADQIEQSIKDLVADTSRMTKKVKSRKRSNNTPSTTSNKKYKPIKEKKCQRIPIILSYYMTSMVFVRRNDLSQNLNIQIAITTVITINDSCFKKYGK